MNSIEAYKDYCGVSDNRFDGLTPEQLANKYGYSGASKFYAGWKAALTVSDEVETLRRQLATTREAYLRACHSIAKMHEWAIGEVADPVLGVVEDVAALRQQLAATKEK